MNYKDLVDVYEKLESTSKRLNKTFYISQLLKKTDEKDLGLISLLLLGRLFPVWDERKIGVAHRIVIKALALSSGKPIDKIDKMFSKIGDLGKIALELIDNKTQSTLFSKKLNVRKVYDNLVKISGLEGQGTVDKKVKLISELLTSASPSEAKYIVRLILEEMRVGVGEGSLRDALVWALLPPVNGIFHYCKKCKQFNPDVKKCINCEGELTEVETKNLSVLHIKNVDELKKLQGYDIIESENPRETYKYMVDKVQHAIDVSNNYGQVAKILKNKSLNGLDEIKMIVGTPLKVMLFQKAQDLKDALETIGTPAALEYKYDGFRMQIHKNNEGTILYTRRLEDVTKQFPDVVDYIENVNAKNFILDVEVIGLDSKTGKWLPFQSISQRIRRKYDIYHMVKKVPVMVNIFDALEINGKNLLHTPFEERRKLMEKVVNEKKDKIVLAKQLITSDLKEAEKFYAEALEKGNEGIMVKNLTAPYKPGSRVGYGVKVKPIMETLDLVIVGADWGTGKRASWLSSFELACRHNDKYLTIGKVGTGFKEKSEEEGLSFEELTKMLKPLIIKQNNQHVTVKPEIVIEISYEEIQKSPTYTSGYALRFPRLVKLRDDRSPDSCSELDFVEQLYAVQRNR